MPIIGRAIGGVFNCVIEGWSVVGAFTEARILTPPREKAFALPCYSSSTQSIPSSILSMPSILSPPFPGGSVRMRALLNVRR